MALYALSSCPYRTSVIYSVCVGKALRTPKSGNKRDRIDYYYYYYYYYLFIYLFILLINMQLQIRQMYIGQ